MESQRTDGNNPDELMAVVNERDEEIGAERRCIIHERGLLHRAIHVLIFNAAGHLLIQKRSKQKDTFPLHWECVGGHLGPGETYYAAARREVNEELGVSPIGLRRLCKIVACTITGMEFVEVYRCEFQGVLRLNESEVVQVEWVVPSQLVRMVESQSRPFSPSFIYTLRESGLI